MIEVNLNRKVRGTTERMGTYDRTYRYVQGDLWGRRSDGHVETGGCVETSAWTGLAELTELCTILQMLWKGCTERTGTYNVREETFLTCRSAMAKIIVFSEVSSFGDQGRGQRVEAHFDYQPHQVH